MASEPAIRVDELEDGASLLWVRALPGAKRAGPSGAWNGHLKVALRSPAEKGRANAELLEVLAVALGLRARELALVSGERAREKRVRVPLPASELLARLAGKTTGS